MHGARAPTWRAGRRGDHQHDGWGGSDPSSIGATIADHIAGQNLLAGILAALFERQRTGRGLKVETSLLGGQVWAQAGEYTHYLMSGEMSGPGGRSHPMIPGIYGMFPTSDGWIAIVGVAGPARDLFYRTIGRPDLIDRFDHLLYFENDKAELWPILNEVFASKTTEEWCDLLGAAGLRFAPVRDHRQVASDPGVSANGYITSVDGSDTDVVRPPVRFTDPLGPVRGEVPELGQHTEEVLLEAASPGRRSDRSQRSGPSEGRVWPRASWSDVSGRSADLSVAALPVDLGNLADPRLEVVATRTSRPSGDQLGVGGDGREGDQARRCRRDKYREVDVVIVVTPMAGRWLYHHVPMQDPM